MLHPTGRHRKPHRGPTSRLWALTAALLALALTAVFVPRHPKPARATLPPPPRRQAPPVPSGIRLFQEPSDLPDPDQVAGALVRPYMPPPPRVPVGDLLVDPAPSPPALVSRLDEADEFSDLAAAVRRYLARVG